MSLHKLTAGSGYDYLTRQVAALDATDKGRTSLASYYTERDESPGVWVGSGMGGIDGLAARESRCVNAVATSPRTLTCRTPFLPCRVNSAWRSMKVSAS